ncbi:MAG TPA: DEAD/DEAH box helicase, partial [Myxococcota bacterium]
AKRKSARDPVNDSEARAVLVDLAHGNTGALDAALVVSRVLEVTDGAEWPVRRAALEAVLTRIVAAESLVVERPRGVRAQAHGQATGAVHTEVYSHERMHGSCSCADFRHASLALCAHLVAAWEHARRHPRQATVCRPRKIGWDPVRPLVGRDDPAARLRAQGRAVGLPGVFAPVARAGAIRALLARRSVEPAARALLEVELGRVEVTGAVVLDESDLRTPLYPYQREGVERFLRAGRLVLADDMGLGKTAQAIAACHALYRAGRVKRGVIVVPAALKPQWAREWRMFSDVRVEVVDGDADARARMRDDASIPFLIVNYEQLHRDVDAVVALAPDIVVLDEAQRIKTWDTKTAQTIRRLTPRYRLALTGTPMENRLGELASVVSFVDDDALEPRWRLDPAYTTRADGKRAVVGAQNLRTLRERIAPIFLRRRRSDVLGHLPKRTDSTIAVNFTAKQAAAHDVHNRSISQLISIAKRRPLSAREHLRLMSALTAQRIICNGLAQSDFEERWPDLDKRAPTASLLASLDTPKLVAVRELVRKLVVTEKRKVVIFSQWRRMLQLVAWACGDVLADAGLRAAFFTGDEGQKRRTQNLVDFHDDDRVRVLFATDAGGVGLNLQRAASACILLEVPWNPAVLEQRIGRIHRNGQRRPVDAFHIVTDGGIEARMRELVGDKRALFTGLFDSVDDTVQFSRDGTFLSRLESIVDGTPVEPRPALAAPAVVDAPARAAVVDAPTLFAAIKAQRDSSGALTITAPPESAQLLAQMFASMAALLTAVA